MNLLTSLAVVCKNLLSLS